MRFLLIPVTALLSICVAAPILAAPARAPARTLAQCEALSVQRLSGPGEYRHRAFILDCMAGKISERLSMTYDECERLSAARGVGPGAPPGNENVHDRLVHDGLHGRKNTPDSPAASFVVHLLTPLWEWDRQSGVSGERVVSRELGMRVVSISVDNLNEAKRTVAEVLF
jgi:hypothetical protein